MYAKAIGNAGGVQDGANTRLGAERQRVADLEADNKRLQAEVNDERAARDQAMLLEREASERCRQAEFEHRMLEGVKSQMMMKLDMLLMTRGEAMDVVKLVRAQVRLRCNNTIPRCC